MKAQAPLAIELYRIRTGEYASGPGDGCAGAFVMRGPNNGRPLVIISSGNLDRWEHVSVSCKNSTPTWEEMCFVKDLFWDREDCVVQYHPPASLYVNHHPHCLHLWRSKDFEFPTPPPLLVGPRK